MPASLRLILRHCCQVLALLAAAPLHGAAPDSGSAIADAMQANDRAAVLRLLQAGADVNALQPDGTAALHWAVHHVDPDLAARLLRQGARPGVRNNFGATPLAGAVTVADLQLARMLLEAGADVEGANQDGQTALMLAVRAGSLPVFELLLRHGASVDTVEQWRGQTALMWAVSDGHDRMAEALIARGADVNRRALATDWRAQVTSEPRAQYRPVGGLTPLLYAARGGCLRCVQMLLDAGAHIDLPNPEGTTALMIAIDNQHYDVAQELLARGANPHLWDWWGRTALYIAVDVRSITRLAGGRGDRLARMGPDGRPKPGSLDMVRTLLERGVDPDKALHMHRPSRGGPGYRMVDDLLTVGCAPLLRAARSHDVEAIELLLQHGATLDLPNVMGVTPFMAAAGVGAYLYDSRGSLGDLLEDPQSHALRTLEVLRRAGADINARVADTSSRTARIARPSTMTGRQGQNALYGAIYKGWPRVVRYLLDAGVEARMADHAGRTPLDAAKGNDGGPDANGQPPPVLPEIVAMIEAARAPMR